MKLQLIGKKLGMTQVYDSDNNLVPVTIIEAGPCPVLQVKTLDKDGYSAIQIGYNPQEISQQGKQVPRDTQPRQGWTLSKSLKKYVFPTSMSLSEGILLPWTILRAPK